MLLQLLTNSWEWYRSSGHHHRNGEENEKRTGWWDGIHRL